MDCARASVYWIYFVPQAKWQITFNYFVCVKYLIIKMFRNYLRNFVLKTTKMTEMSSPKNNSIAKYYFLSMF